MQFLVLRILICLYYRKFANPFLKFINKLLKIKIAIFKSELIDLFQIVEV